MPSWLRYERIWNIIGSRVAELEELGTYLEDAMPLSTVGCCVCGGLDMETGLYEDGFNVEGLNVEGAARCGLELDDLEDGTCRQPRWRRFGLLSSGPVAGGQSCARSALPFYGPMEWRRRALVPPFRTAMCRGWALGNFQ